MVLKSDTLMKERRYSGPFPAAPVQSHHLHSVSGPVKDSFPLPDPLLPVNKAASFSIGEEELFWNREGFLHPPAGVIPAYRRIKPYPFLFH